MPPSEIPTAAAAAARLAAGEPSAAAAICRAALKQNPKDVRALRELARALYVLRDFSGAADAARRELAIARVEPFAEQALAAALTALGDFDAALAALDRAAAVLPNTPGLVAARCETLLQARRHREAEQALAPLLAVDSPDPEVVYAFARIAGRVGRAAEAIERLQHALTTAEIPAPSRIAALFQLGALLDGEGRYDQAFTAWSQANALRPPRRGLLDYNASLRRMLAAWTAETTARLPRADQRSDLPVYIVGMPRSGTSLIEQIIASHPEVHGADERQDIDQAVQELEADVAGPRLHLTDPKRLTAAGLSALSQRVLRSLRDAGPGKRRVADKNPTNYLHLGLIGLLFPRGRVIHCQRDALDTCLSRFSNNLIGPHMCSHDLSLLGAWHRQYQRVMAHWRASIDLPILDVPYEALVEDPPTWTRRIIEFLGLPWDDRCLRFYDTRRATLTPSADQVRRPMYASSIGRWRHYAAHLAPLRAALGIAEN